MIKNLKVTVAECHVCNNFKIAPESVLLFFINCLEANFQWLTKIFWPQK